MNVQTFMTNGLNAQRAVDAAVSAARPAEKEKLGSVNPTRLLCRSAVKKFLLEEAAASRAHKFNRVAESTLIHINEVVKRECRGIVHRLPSKGKTI